MFSSSEYHELEEELMAAKERIADMEASMLLELQRVSINIENVPWLVKDFAILYRTATSTLGAMDATLDFFEMRLGIKAPESREFLNVLRTQLDRLESGYLMCQSVRVATLKRKL